jgi:hypothetical protein
MKCIINVLSAKTYESMRFASQMLNISVHEIQKSLDSEKAYRASDGKLYKFRESGARKTLTPKPLERFPFGKYKGKLIFTCTDKSYLNWLVNLEDASARLKRPVRARLKALNFK